MQRYIKQEKCAEFYESKQLFTQVVSWLCAEESEWLTHDQLERELQDRGRALLKQLLQDHLVLRAQREPRMQQVKGIDGVSRSYTETSNRELGTVFGEVDVPRLAYRKKNHGNLFPSDSVLNLPTNKYSHEMARNCAIEASRGSFDEAVKAMKRHTGTNLGKRQLEEMVSHAANDFDLFYEKRPVLTTADDILVLSCDGKGIVMLKRCLREQTRKAAETTENKLTTRLSKGEKRNRKRMATIGAVYDCTPLTRTAADIIRDPKDTEDDGAKLRPKTRNKWLTASVQKDTAEVIIDIFDEAERRDPLHRRKWVVLVDGACHQLDSIELEAHRRGIQIDIIVDFVHVLEYLWKAAWCFFDPGDWQAEFWVYEHAMSILNGDSSIVAGAIRRKATCLGLGADKRKNVDACADYLINKRDYLNYPLALNSGWPIATGVIEGACRYLAKDRMDITGARWGLDSAEAVLKLRALLANDDFDNYWQFHL
jgi:hypothetical protein